jgi:small subunit ribosomal protein S2
MQKLPGALIVVDVRAEITALKEARKLGIPTICLIDTDGDPEYVDIPIPGNDDSMRSIDVVVRELCLAIHEAQQQRSLTQPAAQTAPAAQGQQTAGSAGDGGARRSRRSQYRSDGSGEPQPAASGS